MAELRQRRLWLALSGRGPEDAEQVRISFGENYEPVVTETQVVGYFLVDGDVASATEWDDHSWPTKIEALDGDGNVIATMTP